MASLLLDCFPMEILDGDASYAPLEWIREVFHSVNNFENAKVKVSVASILGVQSSGKSTFLNTMFGINFAVSSGRCTRGAYLQLVKVDSVVKNHFCCDYLAVIDTEGLKSAEANRHDNECDNELATLTVGISDVSVMNIGGENDESMKDVLQIVCHAFLRMTEALNQRPRCIMVHQNVSDLLANKNTTIAKVKFLQTLDEMTQLAAGMENCKKRYKKFEDVIHYNPKKMNICIPGLWDGNPPMAPVNIDYSEAAQKTKKLLLQEVIQATATTLDDFAKRLQHVYKAVRQDNFIFGFQNIMAAKAYQDLAHSYDNKKWEIETTFLNWLACIRSRIEHKTDSSNRQKEDIIIEGRKQITAYTQELKRFLKEYILKHEGDASFLEEYRYLLERDIIHTQSDMSRDLICHVAREFDFLKEEGKLIKIVTRAEEYLRPKLLELKNKYRTSTNVLTDVQIEALKVDFEELWQMMMGEIEPTEIEKPEIENTFKECLLYHVKNNSHHLRKEKWEKYCYQVNFKDISFPPDISDSGSTSVNCVSRKDKQIPSRKHKLLETAQFFTGQILIDCDEFVSSFCESPSLFRKDVCHAILQKTTQFIENVSYRDFEFTPYYTVNMLDLVSTFAAKKLSTMHDKYTRLHDPGLKLEEQKNVYLNLLLSLAEMGNHEQVFGEQILHGILSKLREHFQIYLLKHVVNDKTEFYNVKQLHLAIFSDLNRSESFDKYKEYISRTMPFILNWIHEQVLSYLSEKLDDGTTRYVKIMIDEGKYILGKLLNVMKETNQYENYTGFVKELQDKTIEKDIHFGLTDNRVEILKMLPVQNVKSFIDHLTDYLQKEIQALIKDELLSVNIKQELTKLAPSIQDQIYQKLMCKDGAQCPFCKAPCSKIGPHEEHRADMHYPQGLGGVRNALVGRLFTSTCPDLVATYIRLFKSGYRIGFYWNYKKYYPNWDIPCDPQPSTSKYWKMVLVKYNTQFAEWYGAKEADIPESWKGYTWPVVREDLEDLYGTRMKN